MASRIKSKTQSRDKRAGKLVAGTVNKDSHDSRESAILSKGKGDTVNPLAKKDMKKLKKSFGRPESDSLFRELDTNQDGKLSFFEIKREQSDIDSVNCSHIRSRPYTLKYALKRFAVYVRRWAESND
jgi:hypothetical protein